MTTDQVIGCNETCLTTHCHTSDRNKVSIMIKQPMVVVTLNVNVLISVPIQYHCRMLQNRAKLNMVVSMVERYVKGTLSVETTERDSKVMYLLYPLVPVTDLFHYASAISATRTAVVN